MWTKAFWLAAAERAAKSAAQAALLTLGADQIDALAVDWADVGGFALGGVVLSVLFSVLSSGVGDGGPSLGGAEKVTPMVEP